jgi:O-antigen ligase
VILYCLLAIVISFQLFLKTKQKFNRFIYILVILFFLSLVLLLSSKAGLIVLLLIAISISIKYLKLTKRNLIIGILALCLFIGLLMKNDRFSQMNNSLYNHYILGKTQVESTNERLIVWGIVIQKLKTDWIFGTGAGDLKYDLTKEYKKNGFTIGEDKMLNAHNQYLETFLSVGILGLLNLVLIFYLTLKKYLAENNLILLGFILIISINFIFESILNNQAGIVFFSLFITMHAVIENNKSNVFKTID